MPKYELHCPICDKKADIGTMGNITAYSLARLDLTFFLCSPCRNIYIDRRVFKAQVKSWKNDYFNKGGQQMPPLKWLYQEFWKKLQDNIDYFVKHLGYKITKFKKVKM